MIMLKNKHLLFSRRIERKKDGSHRIGQDGKTEIPIGIPSYPSIPATDHKNNNQRRVTIMVDWTNIGSGWYGELMDSTPTMTARMNLSNDRFVIRIYQDGEQVEQATAKNYLSAAKRLAEEIMIAF